MWQLPINNQNGKVRLYDTVLEETVLIRIYRVSVVVWAGLTLKRMIDALPHLSLEVWGSNPRPLRGLCAFEQHSSIHCHVRKGLIEFSRTTEAKQQISVVLRTKTSRISPQGEIILKQCKNNCIQLQCKILALALNGFPAGSFHTLNIFTSNKIRKQI